MRGSGESRWSMQSGGRGWIGSFADFLVLVPAVIFR